MDLVIMAAGMGSRFGGLKQMQSIDENGNFIIDYSIFDAIRCGFDRVVFIIRQENFETFRATIGKRIEKQIETSYVFQSNDFVPAGITIPETRKKPLGTGHALLCVKGAVHSNFAIINADDFYGYDAFKNMADYLKNKITPNRWCMVGYNVQNTCSSNGEVKRGLCKIKNGFLKSVKDMYVLKTIKNYYYIKEINSEESNKKRISKNQIVSMNLFGMSPKVFDYLDIQFVEFLNKNKDSLDFAEFGLPSIVDTLIKENKIDLEIVNTNAIWKGLTFKDDLVEVTNYIKKLKDENVYPKVLWK